MPKPPSREAISDEMRHLSALLADELLKWPDVTARIMFGFRAFYRGALIFALLPEKRTLETPRAISFKIDKWQSFNLEDEQSIKAALAHLAEAYENARLAEP